MCGSIDRARGKLVAGSNDDLGERRGGESSAHIIMHVTPPFYAIHVCCCGEQGGMIMHDTPPFYASNIAVYTFIYLILNVGHLHLQVTVSGSLL